MVIKSTAVAALAALAAGELDRQPAELRRIPVDSSVGGLARLVDPYAPS
jgi:hypothetical protein